MREQCAAKAMRLHMRHGDSIVHAEKFLTKQSSAKLELEPSGCDRRRTDGAAPKRDVRRGRRAVALVLVHRREVAPERVQKVGPIDEMLGRAVQHRPCHSHRIRVPPERLENLRAPIGADDAVIFGERDNLAPRLLDRACAKLEHRRARDANPRQPIRSRRLCGVQRCSMSVADNDFTADRGDLGLEDRETVGQIGPRFDRGEDNGEGYAFRHGDSGDEADE